MRSITSCLLLCAALGVPAGSSLAADAWVAQIKVSTGVVTIERNKDRFDARVGTRLREKDVIVTGQNSSVGMLFDDNSTLSLGADSEVVLQRYVYDPTTYMGAFDALLKRGSASVTTGNIAGQSPQAMRVVTPKAELHAGKLSSYAVSVGGK